MPSLLVKYLLQFLSRVSILTRDIDIANLSFRPFVRPLRSRIVFFWKLAQIRTSNFRKVVRQQTEGMVGGIINYEFRWKFTSLSGSD